MADDIYRAIAEQSPHANFVFDLDSDRFIYVNQAFRSLTASGEDEVFVNSLLELVHPEDRQYLGKSYQSLLKGVNKQTIDIRLLVNKEEKHIRLTPILLSTASGRFIIVYAADITADTHNLQTLKKYANKKNSILNILAHDLRGPLGIANTVTQMLTRKLEDPQLIDMIKTVSKILNQSLELITDLTGREFLETTGVELFKQRVNIAQKLKEYIEEAEKSSARKKRTFNFSSSDNSIFLSVDESKFMQVINNLMTNALKFTGDDGVISLTIKEQKDSVLFTFADNGIGIPKQHQPTLFAKFTDARRVGLHGEATIGLGLSIVKTIIEWHEGKIWVESDEGAGTTFYIELPKD